ncbi:restriction endonuclease [Paraglaciecola arctica]|uniref:Restriction system protein n=1 Tax=Paraglaciecola arctica BSs20135 TaxID=493475 RepID=K6Y930_9ALTE|nr:restriction endonuclease [Paraglaciecola arctica]GAC20451.1 restriction system protein [Paraglaciecola arctica BSs20135]
MSRKNPSLLKELSYLPWWVSVIVGICVYVGLKFVIPNMEFSNLFISSFAAAAQKVAEWFGGIFLFPAILSIFNHQKRKQLIKKQSSIEPLRETSWSDFEVLVGEAFRRKGFAVQENMVGGADGGIDLTLRKDGKLHIVQCKQWRRSKVGVSIVREMFGVLTASNAERVHVVSSGHFTNDAIKFAQGLPIELINGDQLLELIADVQTTKPLQTAVKPIDKPVVKPTPTTTCPKCASPMVKRIAKKGANLGNEFLGCSGFPRCRHIEPL